MKTLCKILEGFLRGRFVNYSHRNRAKREKQSSQVNWLPKSEIFDGLEVHCDTEGVTFLGGGGGRSALPEK